MLVSRLLALPMVGLFALAVSARSVEVKHEAQGEDGNMEFVYPLEQPLLPNAPESATEDDTSVEKRTAPWLGDGSGGNNLPPCPGWPMATQVNLTHVSHSA